MFKDLKSLQINFALIAFLSFIIKMILVDASIADSIIVIALGSLYAYTQYLKRFQPYKLEEAVVKDLAEVKAALSKINMIRATEKMTDRKYF